MEPLINHTFYFKVKGSSLPFCECEHFYQQISRLAKFHESLTSLGAFDSVFGARGQQNKKGKSWRARFSMLRKAGIVKQKVRSARVALTRADQL